MSAGELRAAVRQGYRDGKGTLSLRNFHIGDLSVLAEDLGALDNLHTLDLCNTGLEALPGDLSFLGGVQTLDLSRNSFRSAKTVIPGLASLPSLRHLTIDLPREEDEDELVLTLASLESLNGTDLTTLPDEEELERYESELLRTLESKDGASSADGQAEQKQGMHSEAARFLDEEGRAGGLRSSLGDQVEDALINEKDVNVGEWQGAQMLFAEAQGLKTGGSPLSGEFDRVLNGILERLNMRLKGTSDKFIQRGERLQSQREMFDYIFEDIIVFMHQSKPNIATILRHLMQSYGEVFNNFVRMLNEMKLSYNKRVEQLRKELLRAEKEQTEILDAAEALEKETEQFDAEKQRMISEHQQERAKLEENVVWLRQENEKLLQRLRHYELNKQRNGSPLSPPSAPSPAVSYEDFGRPASSRVESSRQAYHQSVNPSSGGGGGGGGGGSSTARSSGNPQPSSRELSLKQTLDVIQEIYNSKSKYDHKCAEAKLPRETMEQHLHTFLNTKYGLKSLILDWANAIVTAVKRFEHQDNDVAVFGKILRNEIDEEFRFVQKQVKDTVKELLRVHLKLKFPLKGDGEIHNLLQRKLNGHVNEDEWVEIVKYMYNQEDALAIVSQVREVLTQEAQTRDRGQNGPPSARTPRTPRDLESARAAASRDKSNRISFGTFLRILLDFQLRGHERFLQRFRDLFRQFDQDRNGVLDEDEFKALVFSLDGTKTEDEVEELLARADPDNNKLLTYSDCVTHLSEELVRLMDLGISGMQSGPHVAKGNRSPQSAASPSGAGVP